MPRVARRVTQRRGSGRSIRARAGKQTSSLRRLGIAIVFAVIGVVQVPGCSVTPYVAAPQAGGQSAPQTSQVGAFAQCPQLFPGHVPTVGWPGRQRALCFDAFAVLHSGESKTPVYTVERLTRSGVEAAKNIKRSDRFYPEARLPAADRAQLTDYAGSGYDRGHMAPAGDMPTVESKAQSFSLANMVPQVPELNQKAWNQIEQATRKYAARASGDVFVFTGPTFAQRPATVGRGQVWVPSHTWKVVYSSGEGRAWAYWMANNAGKQSLQPISYPEFEQRSGLQLLAGAN